MIEPLLLPLLFFAARYFITESCVHILAQRVAIARHAAVRVINGLLVSTVLNMAINIVVLLVVIFGLRNRMPLDQRVLVISTVYAGSVLHTMLKVAANGYWLLEFARYLVRHGMYGPKAWLRMHVAREVHAHFREMGPLRRIAYRFSGAPRPQDLVEIITREIWAVVATKVGTLIVIMAVYAAMFSLYMRPILVEQATRLNWLQAFLWPFGFSIDYFLHTHSVAWIESALRV